MLVSGRVSWLQLLRGQDRKFRFLISFLQQESLDESPTWLSCNPHVLIWMTWKWCPCWTTLGLCTLGLSSLDIHKDNFRTSMAFWDFHPRIPPAFFRLFLASWTPYQHHFDPPSPENPRFFWGLAGILSCSGGFNGFPPTQYNCWSHCFSGTRLLGPNSVQFMGLGFFEAVEINGVKWSP